MDGEILQINLCGRNDKQKGGISSTKDQMILLRDIVARLGSHSLDIK